ncbi:hypothetical protein [Streptomyces werraensis]|uniref:hypothetical protein n=1 Tax=Streptomyces werraensis TaxID=68284 RepID=UPI0037D4493E
MPGARAPDLRRPTLVLWNAFFLVMAAFYFVTSWTPTLLVKAGMSATQSLTGGTLLNLGGVFGTALLGALAARYALDNVLRIYLSSYRRYSSWPSRPPPTPSSWPSVSAQSLESRSTGASPASTH